MAEGDNISVDIQMAKSKLKQLETELRNLGGQLGSLKESCNDEKVVGNNLQNVDEDIDRRISFLRGNVGRVEVMVANQVMLTEYLPKIQSVIDEKLNGKIKSCGDMKSKLARDEKEFKEAFEALENEEKKVIDIQNGIEDEMKKKIKHLTDSFNQTRVKTGEGRTALQSLEKRSREITSDENQLAQALQAAKLGLKKAQDEEEKIQSDLNGLEINVQALQQESNDVEKECEILTKKNQETDEKLSFYHVNDIEKEVAELENSTSDLEAIQNQISDAKNVDQSLSNEIKNMKDEITDMEKVEIENLMVTEELEKVQMQENELGSEIRKAREQAEIRGMLEAKGKEMECVNDKMMHTNEELRFKVQSLKANAQSSMEEIKSFEAKVVQLHSAVKESEELLETQVQAIDRARDEEAKSASLQSDKKRLQQQIDDLEETMKKEQASAEKDIVQLKDDFRNTMKELYEEVATKSQASEDISKGAENCKILLSNKTKEMDKEFENAKAAMELEEERAAKAAKEMAEKKAKAAKKVEEEIAAKAKELAAKKAKVAEEKEETEDTGEEEDDEEEEKFARKARKPKEIPSKTKKMLEAREQQLRLSQEETMRSPANRVVKTYQTPRTPSKKVSFAKLLASSSSQSPRKEPTLKPPVKPAIKPTPQKVAAYNRVRRRLTHTPSPVQSDKKRTMFGFSSDSDDDTLDVNKKKKQKTISSTKSPLGSQTTDSETSLRSARMKSMFIGKRFMDDSD